MIQIIKYSKKIAYSALMLVSIAPSLIFAELGSRIIYFFLIGMESPTGNGSPLAFVIGLGFESIVAIIAGTIIALITMGAKLFESKRKIRIIYLLSILLTNFAFIVFATINIYKVNQKNFHGKLYEDDVKGEIKDRFEYKMGKIDSAIFKPGIEIYFERVHGCKIDSSIFKSNRLFKMDEREKWLESFSTIKVDNDGGWSMSSTEIDINNYLFSDSTQISDHDWQALYYNKNECMIIATWTNH